MSALANMLNSYIEELRYSVLRLEQENKSLKQELEVYKDYVPLAYINEIKALSCKYKKIIEGEILK
jgi:hypothetical protein